MNLVDIVITGKNVAGPAFAQAERQSAGLRTTMARTGAVSGLVLAGIGVASLKMSADFEASMTRLSTQAHVPQSELGTLKKGVLDLAGSVGADPDSLAESLFHVESNFSSLGISSPKALHLVETAAKGAKVGQADLVDVTNALTAAVASGIPGVQDFDQAMGVLNATVGAGDMKMQDLADAFSTGMVAVVKGYGLSITDVGAALAVFGDNNIRGANAGTQLRIAVQSLAVPAKGSADALEKLGLKSDTLAKDMQTGGLLKAMQDLKDHMDKAGISAKEQGQIVTELFGKKAGTGINVLLDQLDRLKSKYPELTKGANEFGDAWDKTKDTAKQKLDELKGSLEALAIKIGDKLMPAVTGLVDFLNNHQGVFNALAITVGVLLVAAFTNWAVAVLSATWPILTIAALAAGLTWAVLQLWIHWDQVWGWISHHKAYAILIAALAPILAAPVLLVGAIKGLYENWDQVWNDIADSVKHPIAGILTAIKSIGDVAFETVLFILKVFAAIPGPMGAPFRKAKKDVGDWKTTFDRNMQGAIDSVEGWSSSSKLAAGGVSKALGQVGKDMAKIPKSKRADVYVQVHNAEAIGGLIGSLAMVPRNITTFVNAVVNAPVGLLAGGLFRRAAGGPVGGAAAGGPRGLTWVGEHGPELVSLPTGSMVKSHPDSARLAGGGGGARVVLEINSGGSKMDDLLVEILRKSVRARGGDVQIVLGRG